MIAMFVIVLVLLFVAPERGKERVVYEVVAEEGSKYDPETGDGLIASLGGGRGGNMVFLPRSPKPGQKVRVYLDEVRPDKRGAMMYRATPAPVQIHDEWGLDGESCVLWRTATDWLGEDRGRSEIERHPRDEATDRSGGAIEFQDHWYFDRETGGFVLGRIARAAEPPEEGLPNWLVERRQYERRAGKFDLARWEVEHCPGEELWEEGQPHLRLAQGKCGLVEETVVTSSRYLLGPGGLKVQFTNPLGEILTREEIIFARQIPRLPDGGQTVVRMANLWNDLQVLTIPAVDGAVGLGAVKICLVEILECGSEYPTEDDNRVPAGEISLQMWDHAMEDDEEIFRVKYSFTDPEKVPIEEFTGPNAGRWPNFVWIEEGVTIPTPTSVSKVWPKQSGRSLTRLQDRYGNYNLFEEVVGIAPDVVEETRGECLGYVILPECFPPPPAPLSEAKQAALNSEAAAIRADYKAFLASERSKINSRPYSKAEDAWPGDFSGEKGYF